MAKELKPNALTLHNLWFGSGGVVGERLDLSGANLDKIDFSYASFYGALFIEAVFTDAELIEAILIRTRFTNADLRFARFDGADFNGADFSWAKNLDKAIWPKGWRLVKEEDND
ncbi:MAG: pentapeptide repeat-containing protein [Deltaproteobacteria bacterium]|jgi:uncharacterized protein YjbI with pentapeptide repeats|nr:pentapeptide repeat-containing protein [Deltaproteobacteria bacterium]